MYDKERPDKLVHVMVSTYNGEKYVKEQLDSIFSQEYTNIKVTVRDDGSSDHTVEVLQTYLAGLKKTDKMDIIEGENVGVKDSFLSLLNICESGDYWAFCDQDDVWFPDKVKTAVDKLSAAKGPALYCCRTMLTNEHLQPVADTLHKFPPNPGFGNALIENICVGCTIVINRDLYELVKGKYPEKSLIHDMWLYQIASCFGTVIYDDEPHIYYRQHEGNVIGLDGGRWALIKRQMASLKHFRGKYSAQAEEMLRMFDLCGEKELLAKKVAGTSKSWRTRWKILLDKKIYRQGFFDNIIFHILLFLGWL